MEDRDIKSSDKCCEPNCDNDVTSKLNVCCSCGKLFCSDHWQAADFIRSEDITGKYSEYFKLERRVPKKITEYTFEPYDKGERIGEMVQKMHGIFVCGKCFEDITGDIKTTPNYKFSDGNVVYDSFSDFGGDVVSSIFG